MNKFQNLKIKTKIYSLAGFLILLVLFIMELSKLNSDAQDKIILAGNINDYILQARLSEKNFFVYKDINYADKFKDAYQNLTKITSQFNDVGEIEQIENDAKTYYQNFKKLVQIEKNLD